MKKSKTNICRVCLAITALSYFFVSVSPALADSHDYKKLLERGVKQLKAQDYDSATATFTSVLRDHPNLFEAYLDRAEARRKLKDLDGALSDYDQAIKINPNVVEAFLHRGQLRAEQGNKAGAVEDYTEAHRLNPRDVQSSLLLAETLKRSGDYAKASEIYSSIIAAQPKLLSAQLESADCKVKAGQYDAAADEYRSLLKKNGAKQFRLHYDLGQVLLLQGDKSGADEQFNQIVAYCTKTIGHSQSKGPELILRGLAYAQLGKNTQAMQDLEGGLTASPNDAAARAALGHIKLAIGDTTGAIAELDEALKLDRSLTSALFDRGAAYLNENGFNAAKTDLDAALAISKTSDGLLNRGMARLGLGDTVGALKDLRQVGTENLDHRASELSEKISKAGGEQAKELPVAWYLEQLAMINIAQNSLDNAETLTKRAISIQEQKLSATDARKTTSLMMLGCINLQRRSLLKAEALFRTALTRSRANPEMAKYAVFNLEECAKVLIQTGNLERAGAILSDTRLERSSSGISEQAFTGDLSRQADRALNVYRDKRKKGQQLTLVSKPTAAESSSPIANKSDASKTDALASTPIRDKWAVVVGISNFKDSKINLHYAAKDAHDFSDFLVKEKNFAPDHVELLTDSAATRANILSVLGSKWLPRVAERNDLVIIYFSTHGSPSSLDLGGLNYLVAYDTDANDLYATGIAMQDLARIIKARVHANRIMLVLDACHSGGAAPNSKGLARVGNIDAEQLMQGTGQLVISSSEPDQVSWESKRYEGSVFTKHLIEGLRANGDLTKLGPAFSHLQEETEREVLRDRGIAQTPVLKSQWEGSDLIIGAPPTAPSPGLTDFVLPDAPTAPKAITPPSKPASRAKGVR